MAPYADPNTIRLRISVKRILPVCCTSSKLDYAADQDMRDRCGCFIYMEKCGKQLESHLIDGGDGGCIAKRVPT